MKSKPAAGVKTAYNNMAQQKKNGKEKHYVNIGVKTFEKVNQLNNGQPTPDNSTDTN